MKWSSKAKNWIDNIKKADCANEHALQAAISQWWEDTSLKPDYKMYPNLVKGLRRGNGTYPAMPKISHISLVRIWHDFVEACKPIFDNDPLPPPRKIGRTRDLITGKYSKSSSAIIRAINEISQAPVLPSNFLSDISDKFVVNESDNTIEIGKCNVIYLKNVEKGTLLSSSMKFIEDFGRYATKEIMNLNDRYTFRSNTTPLPSATLEIVKYHWEEGRNISGFIPHLDKAHYGTMIWILEEEKCFAEFRYKGPTNNANDWHSYTRSDGFTQDNELLMVDHLYHSVSVFPTIIGEAEHNWHRIILLAFL